MAITLLTSQQIQAIDGMCPAMSNVNLGEVINGLINYANSKTPYTLGVLTTSQIKGLDNICIGLDNVNLGTIKQEFWETLIILKRKMNTINKEILIF